MTRTRLPGQQESGRKKQRRERESKRHWIPEEAGKLGPEEGQRVLEGLWRQECIGVFSVHSDAAGDLDVRTRV